MRFCIFNNKNANEELQAKKSFSFFWFAFYVSKYHMYNYAHVKIKKNLIMSFREVNIA